MKAAALLVALLCAANAAGGAPLRVEVLWNPPMAETAALGPLSGALAVRPDRLLLVGSRSGAFLLGWGGAAPVAGLAGCDALAYSSSGLLFAIRGRDLVAFSKEGPRTLFQLPAAGMGLAAGARGRMLLFDRAPGARSALYELRPDGKIAKLLESPAPIGGAAEASDGRIVFSAGGALFEAAPGKPMRLLAGGARTLGSVALGPDGTVYASDGAAVLAVKGERLSLITKKAGGELRWVGNGLLVLDARRPLIARLIGL